MKLLGNRSAAHFRLGNNRSCLRDCQWTLRLDATNKKVALRAAEALLKMSKGKKALQWIDRVLLQVRMLLLCGMKTKFLVDGQWR